MTIPLGEVSIFYGNGAVYVATEGQVKRFSKYNFAVESLSSDAPEQWLTDGLIVALGCDCALDDAIERLHAVIRRLESRASEGPSVTGRNSTQ